MIPSGTGKVGGKIVTIDGHGTIKHVYDQDNILVEMDRDTVVFKNGVSVTQKVQGKYDLSKCAWADDPKAEEVMR